RSFLPHPLHPPTSVLSLHDALPIYPNCIWLVVACKTPIRSCWLLTCISIWCVPISSTAARSPVCGRIYVASIWRNGIRQHSNWRSEEHTSELQSPDHLV